MDPLCRVLLGILSVFCLNARFVDAQTGIPKGAASLVFVFDTTGSMYDDLVQVRDGAARILSTTLERKVNPLFNYVLIPFHDPDVGPALVTTSPEKFQQHLDDLFVQGGGDCPEMTLSAIALALEISLPGSFIYVFTDSHAKDYELTQKVVRLIQQKQSQVIFVVTGDCGNETLSQGFAVFELISATSSGQVFRLKKKDVNQVLKFVEESVQANRVNLLSTDVGEAADRTYTVPVDNALQELTISVSGKDASLKLYDPAGNLVTKESGLQRLLNLKGVKIVRVEKPKPGLWHLSTSSSGSHTLRITGYSSLHFFSGFGLRPIRSPEEAAHRPVAGFRNFAIINVKGLKSPGEVEKVQLLDLQGKLISEVPLKSRVSDKLTFDWLNFEPPRELFYVRVLGFDEDQNVFHRASPTALSAVLPDPPEVSAPSSHEVLLGSSVKLWCTVKTEVPSKIQWTMGRRTLGPVHTRIGTFNVTHVIPLVGHKDKGPYSCFASNIGGTDTVTSTLIIKVPDSVFLDRSYSNLTVVNGDLIILTCALFGATPVSLVWRKDGRDMDEYESTAHQTNGSLLIQIRGREDSGRYECVALHQGRHEVRVVDVEVYERPSVSADPPRRTFQSGDDVSIECHVGGYPEPSLLWYKEGQQLETEGRFLHIGDAQRSDSGIYECVAWNIAGQSQAAVQLEYTIPPSVFVDQKEIVAKAGNTVTVKCTASAKPDAKIQWFKGANRVTPNRRIAVSSRGHLVINAVETSDAGIFTCLAGNIAGQQSVSVTVRVQIPPRVTVDSVKVPLVPGDALVLQCTAVGIPSPTITWLKNDKVLSSNDRLSISDGGVLIIRDALPQDAGLYHCVGVSSAGKAAAVVTVHGEGVPAKITTPPSDKIVTIGSSVSFKCRATGVPTPRITWQNSLQIAADTDPRAAVLPSGDLVIRDIELKDAGRYVCLAENRLGRDKAQVTLTLTGLTPPIILKPAKTTVIAERNETVKLHCPTIGTPRPTILWRKNGKRVAIDGTKFRQTATGTLVITGLLPFDSGSYLCMARNRAGLDLLSLALYVYIAPEIISLPPNMTVDEGDTILMECVARGFPIPRIRWIRDNHTLREVSRLELSQLTIQDAGVYRCIAENVAGNATATAVLSVRAPPKVIQATAPVAVLSGGDAELNCNVSGNPKPSVSWSRQGVAIPTSDPKYLVLPSGRLSIAGVIPSDSGTYICLASNPLGTARQSSVLFVQVPPKVVEHPQNITIEEGDTLILKCVARGFPAPFMTWYLNGHTLITNSFTVEISEASKSEHEGLYLCEAQNPAGTVSASAVVTVREKDSNVAQNGKPEFSDKPEDAVVGAGSDFRWDCTAKGQPKPVITWKKDGKKLRSGFSQHIRILANNSLMIRGARPGDEGQYQCHASNGFGAHVVQAKLVVRVDGRWSDWQDWEACSQSCGGGTQLRYRQCDNPVPGRNGKPCPGTNVESRLCNQAPCAVDGEWSLWSEWTLCSKVCDAGEHTRYRECNNPPARFGGKDCSGNKRESRPCNFFKCPDSVGVAIGQVHGTINNVMLPNLLLLANVTKTETNETRVSCSVGGMPGPIKNWLKSSLIPLTSPVYWATAGEQPGTENGLSITKGRFVYKTHLNFKTGESLVLVHRGQGVNEKGVFVVDIDIKGGTPKLPMGVQVKFPDFQEHFIQTGVGQISSYSERVLSVDGKSVPYSCNTTIAYFPVDERAKSLSQAVQVTEVDVSTPRPIDALKIDMTAVVERASSTDQCAPGLIMDTSGRFCRDIDECIAVPRVCSQSCQNLFGSFRCSCTVGHVLAADDKTCEDIDECLQGTSSCPPRHDCINTPGAYRCRVKCDDGFVMSDNDTCVDINECEFARTTDYLDPNDPCLHECENRLGSYKCSCKDGYRLKDDLCEDIDECSTRVCDHGCQNQAGSYSCYCYQGYRLISGSRCVDIDECAENITLCADLQCVNVPGSFQCLGKCAVGFKRTMDDKECVDVNECKEGQHNCKLNHMCTNTAGSFYCVCSRGYSARTPQSPCEDVDECTQFPGICEFQCLNSVGSFECLCPVGGVLNPDQRTCTGVDGCALSNLKCEQRCGFSAQGYHCSCSRGYRLAENKQDCVDVDECASNRTNSCQFACTNTLGGFKCRCPVGYYLSPNGNKCLDVDECSLTSGPCNDGRCFNTRGSYRCVPSSCPQQYRQVGGGFCVNQCSNPGYCAAQALRQDIITLPQGVPANNIVARLVPFFPPYMASMRYYCEFQYSFSVNPSPFAIRMLGSELVVYTKETLSRAAMHQMQVTANLFYMDGRLACRTVFTVYIDVAKFSF